MSRNLKGQISYAINCNFTEGTDKHAYKAEVGREMGSKIFSYSESFRLKDVASNLQSFIKQNFTEVKFVKNIDSNIIQNFLNSKVENCTQNTVNSYASSLFKIQNVLNNTYKDCNLNWREEVEIPTVPTVSSTLRGADSVISREDYNTILEYCTENPSQSSYALQLQDFLGVRVEEVVRIKLDNINLQEQTITLEGKGGRITTREIPENKLQLVKEIVEQKYNKERLLSIEGSSINKYLNRLEDKLALERHSVHDIRRLIAQEKFDRLRENGKSIKEAISETSKWLSHGEGRQAMLERSYINIH